MKSKGRPKGPEKVVFKRRVTPDMAAFLDKQLKGFTYGGPEPAGWVNTEFAPENVKAMEGFVDTHVPTFAGPAFDDGVLKKQVAALLEDVEKVTKERDELLVKRENWLRATDDQKTTYWRDRALKAEAYALKKAEEQ